MSHYVPEGDYCFGGAEVKGPQFVAAQSGPLAIKDPETVGSYGDWSIGIAVAKDQRYQIIMLDPIDLGPTWNREIEEGIAAATGDPINPFRTLATLEAAKMIHDTVKAEVTRQMQEWRPDAQVGRVKQYVTAEVKRQLRPAIIAAMTRTTWQLNAEDPF
jgi:hypothetical protein